MKTKQTKVEKTASALCRSIREGYTTDLAVEWVRSATWGRNPVIRHRGERATSVSGCGYCKHSTALADALCFLGETEEQSHAIACTGGAGVSSVKRALAAQGWILEEAASGNTFDAYTIRRA